MKMLIIAVVIVTLLEVASAVSGISTSPPPDPSNLMNVVTMSAEGRDFISPLDAIDSITDARQPGGIRAPTVCAGETGVAYRLCDVYCEKLDCDWNPEASERQCDRIQSRYLALTGQAELPCDRISPGCVTGDSWEEPPFPFDVGDGNDYGERVLQLTVPEQCECDASECTPCPVVVGFHGYGEEGNTWRWRLDPKGRAAGFISLYPTGDRTPSTYDPSGSSPNWAVPSCQDPNDGCLGNEWGTACDWCGEMDEDNAVSTRRESDFTRAIIKWTMDHHCVDPGQIFATGYSNGALWSYQLAMNPATSKLFKAIVAVDGVDQAGFEDHLKWINAPSDGYSPWVLHVNEVFDNLEPYDGRPYTEPVAAWNPVWIYPPVLQVLAELQKNPAYSECDFGEQDVGDRYGALAAGGVVPEGYRRLDGPGSLEGEDQKKFHCFTKDAAEADCRKLAICLWDSGAPGDDLEDPHARAGREWHGGVDPGTDGTKPMDIMWRFMQRSVGVSD